MVRALLLLALVLFSPSCGRQNRPNAPAVRDKTEFPTAPYDEPRVSVRDSSTIECDKAAWLIKPLVDPAKLATLGSRGANSRIQKVSAILWKAKSDGLDPVKVAEDTMVLVGWGGTEKGHLTAAAMVRNVSILERLGCTTPEDLNDMRHGKTAIVRKGPYAGEVLSVDHVIPRAVAPELDNLIANLELMPLSLNRNKSDTIGQRQVSMAKAFHDAGLLSDAGFKLVMDAKQ